MSAALSVPLHSSTTFSQSSFSTAESAEEWLISTFKMEELYWIWMAGSIAKERTLSAGISSANASEPANLWRTVIVRAQMMDFQDGRRWGRCSHHTGPT